MSSGETPQLSDDPFVGRVISDRYRVLKKLGEGGMGSVYLAEHVLIEKKVALKVLAPELARRPDLAARFLQEAKSASRIGHENVIDISDFAQSPEGFVYIAMEYLDGQDLAGAMREAGPLSWARAKPIVLQICRALRAAHARGIVHRDMKPENVFLIQREGRPDFVKLLDFGIAKVMGIADAPRLTRTGMIFGTPEFMAPEQAEGKDTDHRVDVYALGCVIYQLVTGDPPFKADSFMATLTKHLLEDPVAPSARRPDLPITPELDALVLKALEKDRDRRWQSMQEVLHAVEACAAPPAPAPESRGSATREIGGSGLPGVMAPPASTPPRTRRKPTPVEDVSLDVGHVGGSAPPVTAPPKKSRLTGVVVGGGIALGVAAAIAWAVLGRRAPEPPTATAPVAAPAPRLDPPPAPPPQAGPAAPAGAGPAPAMGEAGSEATAPVAATPPPGAQPAVKAAPARPAPGRGKRTARRISAEDPAAAAAPAAPSGKADPTPAELKPFPQ